MHHQKNSRLLDGLSLIFKTISFLNLKRKSLALTPYPDAVIISIDNLSFGGTGKTSLVMAIGQFLETRDLKFAIVTRGYKSKAESRESVKVQPFHGVEDVGDEALLFHSRFPHHDVYVGKNRSQSIRAAIRDQNPILLLDDGFQSTHVHKDFKVMLINPAHPYYYLRNFRFLMKDEDIILYYHNHNHNHNHDHDTEKQGNTYWFELDDFFDAQGNRVDVRTGAPSLWGFSALGDNQRFKNDLSSFHLAGFTGFPDHHFYTETDIRNLNARRIDQNVTYLVCTEKDFIKIKHFNLNQIPLIYPKNSIKFNFDFMNKLLEVCSRKIKK
ncbi:MAG: tetraacyldisaccharide 4'-kinase [Candidatus Omnitrophota bacterium]